MDVKIDLSKYSTGNILQSYEFIYSLWLGGEISDQETIALFPTVPIYREILSGIRKELSPRKDFKSKVLRAIEDEALERMTKIMQIPENKLREIMEERLIGAEDMLRELRDNLPLD